MSHCLHSYLQNLDLKFELFAMYLYILPHAHVHPLLQPLSCHGVCIHVGLWRCLLQYAGTASIILLNVTFFTLNQLFLDHVKLTAPRTIRDAAHLCNVWGVRVAREIRKGWGVARD